MYYCHHAAMINWNYNKSFSSHHQFFNDFSLRSHFSLKIHLIYRTRFVTIYIIKTKRKIILLNIIRDILNQKNNLESLILNLFLFWRYVSIWIVIIIIIVIIVIPCWDICSTNSFYINFHPLFSQILNLLCNLSLSHL